MVTQADGLDDLGGRVYDAALDPSLWAGIISDLSDRTDSVGASYMVTDINSGAGEVIWSRELDHSKLDDFHRYYAAINPLMLVTDAAAYSHAWRPTMMRDQEWIERSALEHSEYFSDFLKPLGLCQGVFLRLGLDGAMLTTISIGRGPQQEHFSDELMARLSSFHGHALRSSRLGRRFADLRRFSAGVTASMDIVDDALVLLDSDGRIVHANPAAERMMTEGNALGSAFGRLTALGGRASTSLSAAIHRAGKPAERIGGTVVLQDRDGHSIEAAVLPVGMDAGLDAAAGPAVLVRVNLRSPRAGLDAHLDSFGLTRAERALVLLMLDGASLRQAATLREVSVNTARRQLACVFEKTGVHRQAELVALLTRHG